MFPILIHAQKNKARIENQRLRDKMDPFLIPTERFIERYRIPPYLVQQLIGELSPYVEDDVEEAIPIHLRVLAALSFYASGCYQRRVGMDAFVMMSQSKISNCVTEISRLITNKLAPIYVKFPQTQEEVNEIKDRFFEDYDIPGILALVDGTKIRVAGLPLDIRNSYVGHKSGTSINTQFIIDSDMRILNVNARFPGSAHDTLIWHNSEIFKLLESKFNLNDQNGNIYRGSFLLGDLGYPLQPWLMIPVKDVQPDQLREKRYNKKHRKIRNKIERFNACAKNRFRCILGERALRYSHEKSGYIIYACATLHNFLIYNSFDIEYGIFSIVERTNEDESDGDDNLNNDGIQNDYLARGQEVRRELMAYHF